jgi:hypothetical protein
MQGGVVPLGEHPFNRALTALYGDIEENFRQHRLRPGESIWGTAPPNGNLPWCMESPDWCHYSGIDLPHYPVRRTEILAIIVRRLNEARRALPNAGYEVTLADKPFTWDETRGFQPPPE